jgi:uracil-DNA glycosylase family 4
MSKPNNKLTRLRKPLPDQNSCAAPEPHRDCDQCPRLVDFRESNKVDHPDWFNGAVPSFGDSDCRMLIVGLAPGLQGANKTGRPFTGDFAGDLLYSTLNEFGFSRGEYGAHAEDGLRLADCMISNAVRCVPPKNKPIGAEIKNCRPFLEGRIAALPNLKAIVALGRIAHESVVDASGKKRKDLKFAHRAQHALPNEIMLFDSYHCSRYNTNTGRLTEEMFRAVFEDVRSVLAV